MGIVARTGALPISDLHPCAHRSQLLASKLDAKCLSAARHVADVCHNCGRFDVSGLFDCISRLEASVETRIPAGLVASYTLLERSVRGGAVEPIQYRLNRFAERVTTSIPLTIRALGSDCLPLVDQEDLMEVFRIEMEASGQNSSIFPPTDRELVEESAKAAAKALDVVNAVAPELYDEMSNLITDILIIDSSKTNAASSFQTFGVIFLKTLKPFQNWTTYVEHLVHEAAHHLLFAIFSNHRIFEKGSNQRFNSPLRSEPRPLDAVFHAMFVLARIIFILRKVADSREHSDFERTATYSFYNPKCLIAQFRDGYNVVSSGASLTPEGKTFLAGINDLAETYAFSEQPLKHRD